MTQRALRQARSKPVGKQPLCVHPGLRVRPCEWGWGVFTDEPIAKGTLIEECHYLVLPWESVMDSPLCDYVFQIEPGERERARGGEWVAVVLGYGMIYNHSSQANVAYYQGGTRNLFTFYAKRDIHPGEQLCVNYGEAWWRHRGQPAP
jgi:hypothetical protein